MFNIVLLSGACFVSLIETRALQQSGNVVGNSWLRVPLVAVMALYRPLEPTTYFRRRAELVHAASREARVVLESET